ncbi:peroxiredoxin [Ignicoccus hospitalis]|uniref:Peroxiredoxin n=1 Tax=Ignicoccus hospitalis (strain KIN4/I / DSM 18386 / JCM 14125) TaxID=453591 RepID=TDXH_IGNH4|nr:peroxiredoxin [Ignicoccus hospitalis]A8A9P0.1 RecName: Full=Peroxiredoxin; AltName: Full=Thioredoxin peroxidase; AltName: Full=Thioredoxin-dependent peroxiredoxin [Ignicoccus hospitalis KIN4/I]ABU81642.1 alkyl hydroperoxide reductase/ Thiol specific antioxidant/ Mal allergen [Ignicoccus hospitalis KIN4/I]HIH89759.1 peroxiredoxin [Desulfurococcaceae archaeon]
MPGQIPLIGEKLPEMVVHTDHGPKKLPDDYKGKWLVIFSHPADFTPVCTTEFVAFAKRYEDFKKLNTELLGLSVDNSFSHIKWKEWIKEKLNVEIPFPIIADPLGQVATKLGMLHPEGGVVTVRAVFIVDPEGKVRAILYYPLNVGRNIDEILRLLKALQVTDKLGRATPANWPCNEIVKDHVIVPPASTEQEAKERLQKYECFDWWFCHEKAPAEDVEEAKKFLERPAKELCK